MQHLDLSGNGMGDAGARLLAKALQINTRLKIVNLGCNSIDIFCPRICPKTCPKSSLEL